MPIGTAGWSISRDSGVFFPAQGHQLRRYAEVLGCVEINSSFYRSHQAEVYERWAALTPRAFRFSVKLPQRITHDNKLRDVRQLLFQFLSEVAGLGPRCAVILAQFPPSLVFEARVARHFFALLSELFDGAVVCEPRHPSWFSPSANSILAALRVSRAAADPARWPEAARPGGWLGPDGDGSGATLYYRWHGSPRMYWSPYPTAWLRDQAHNVGLWPTGTECWCIFDNTAGGGAIPNALALQRQLRDGNMPGLQHERAARK